MGQKYQVTRSTGKHTNAVLCCLSWFRENLQDYVNQRRLSLNESEKVKFMAAITEGIAKGSSRMELIELAPRTHAFLSSGSPLVSEAKHVRNFADLILCALSKNQKHVKAVAANYRSHMTVSSNEPARKKQKV
jgi:hypothetical protein